MLFSQIPAIIDMKRQLLIVALLAFMFSACNTRRSHDVDFYYWKSKCEIGETERDYFSQLESKRLFVRLFDVDVEAELFGLETEDDGNVGEGHVDGGVVFDLLQLFFRVFHNVWGFMS